MGAYNLKKKNRESTLIPVVLKLRDEQDDGHEKANKGRMSVNSEE
jgi:hypothetical protein